jgi:hypothetical protein
MRSLARERPPRLLVSLITLLSYIINLQWQLFLPEHSFPSHTLIVQTQLPTTCQQPATHPPTHPKAPPKHRLLPLQTNLNVRTGLQNRDKGPKAYVLSVFEPASSPQSSLVTASSASCQQKTLVGESVKRLKQRARIRDRKRNAQLLESAKLRLPCYGLSEVPRRACLREDSNELSLEAFKHIAKLAVGPKMPLTLYCSAEGSTIDASFVTRPNNTNSTVGYVKRLTHRIPKRQQTKFSISQARPVNTIHSQSPQEPKEMRASTSFQSLDLPS